MLSGMGTSAFIRHPGLLSSSISADIRTLSRVQVWIESQQAVPIWRVPPSTGVPDRRKEVGARGRPACSDVTVLVRIGGCYERCDICTESHGRVAMRERAT
jgi:hypothetical protein